MPAKPRTKAAELPRLKPGLTATADYGERLAPFDQKTLALWAAECAEHVVAHFETRHPNDERPRQAIDTARAWARDEKTMMMARAASVKTHAAAREAIDPAAVAAARAAGHAAGTAHSIRHARGAAAYAIVSAAASVTAEERERAVAAERKWQLAHMPHKQTTER